MRGSVTIFSELKKVTDPGLNQVTDPGGGVDFLKHGGVGFDFAAGEQGGLGGWLARLQEKAEEIAQTEKKRKK